MILYKNYSTIILYYYIYLSKLTGDLMDNNRLQAFENMLSAILDQYNTTTQKMADLKAAGKEKTVTYRQLFANKLQLQTILSYYRAYGLIDER